MVITEDSESLLLALIPNNISDIVEDIELKPSEALLPLFECIVNSIISLNNLNKNNISDKKIVIEISRGSFPDQTNTSETKTIKSIIITDNGEGFTDINFKSFRTPHSKINKTKWGCKGLGRFTVLAAFKEMQVLSIFEDEENKTWKKREFTFKLDGSGTHKEENTTKKVRETIIELKNIYKKDIKNSTALSLEEIADEIREHCFIYYLCNQLPKITLIEHETQEEISINALFEKDAQKDERAFELKREKFKCYIVKTTKNNRKNHNIYYCANSRVVGKKKALNEIDNIFSYPIQDKGSEYFLDVYIVSDYLNKNVYSQRNGFTIPLEVETKSSLFDKDEIVAFQEIQEELVKILKQEFNEFIKQVQNKNIEDVKKYITSSAPRYRRFLDREDILRKIPHNLTENKLEEYLYKISLEEKKKVDNKIQRFIKNKEITKENIQEIQQDLKEKAKYGSDNLAEYMCQRKAIIDLFRKYLRADQNGKYKLEEDIHNLIFPMGFTNNELNYEDHNLWLLDERFTTYKFINSDKKITTVSQINSQKEPDLLMFDNPISFADKSAGDISSMVVFEFKRPGETAHNKKSKDFRWKFEELIEKYFDDFLYGKVKKNYQGDAIDIRKTTPKFGYIIVDLIPHELEEYNLSKGYKKTPFNTFYYINPELNLHIEVIKFQQLIDFAEKRHLPFFDRLFPNN